MNQKSLLAFIQRILANGSTQKSRVALKQLANILEQQNADPGMVELIHKSLQALPEAKEAAKKSFLTAEELRIAQRRAEDRQRREAAARMQSRC